MTKYFDDYFKSPAKQKRSKDRVEKILDAIEELANDRPNQKLDVRSISSQAHISIGALYHHFPSIDNLFTSLFIRRINRTQLHTIQLIDECEPSLTLEQFAYRFIDHAFSTWDRGDLRIKKIAIRFFYRNAEDPELLYTFINPLIPHFKAFLDRNTSNTFRAIDKEEWFLLLRTTQAAVASPFIEQQEIAGSDLHRKFAKDCFCRLFSK